MPKSKADKLRDAAQLGIPRVYLSRLARQGQLEKIAGGLYRHRGSERISTAQEGFH